MERSSAEAFEEAVSPHLASVYNLARWLVRDDHDAEDVVQEALVRAFRFWPGFSGHNLRAWLLTVVRNACFTFLGRRQERLREEREPELAGDTPAPGGGPEAELLRAQTGARISAAVATLPADYRDVFLLREVEGLSYKEIAEAVGVPMGTVMSRLSRARALLRRELVGVASERVGR